MIDPDKTALYASGALTDLLKRGYLNTDSAPIKCTKKGMDAYVGLRCSGWRPGWEAVVHALRAVELTFDCEISDKDKVAALICRIDDLPKRSA